MLYLSAVEGEGKFGEAPKKMLGTNFLNLRLKKVKKVLI
jgi:hypothetical protein